MTDPVAPVPPAAPAPAPAAAGPKQTLSLVGFIIGCVAFLFGWTVIFGLLAGIAAIIVSNMGRKREPGAPKWMWMVGLIAGIVGAVVSIIVTILWVVVIVADATALSSVGSLTGSY
jgi:hypothetical protein